MHFSSHDSTPRPRNRRQRAGDCNVRLYCSAAGLRTSTRHPLLNIQNHPSLKHRGSAGTHGKLSCSGFLLFHVPALYQSPVSVIREDMEQWEQDCTMEWLVRQAVLHQNSFEFANQHLDKPINCAPQRNWHKQDWKFHTASAVCQEESILCCLCSASPPPPPDPHSLGVRCLVNGDTVQSSNTDQMIFKTEALIAWVSKCVPSLLSLSARTSSIYKYFTSSASLKLRAQGF